MPGPEAKAPATTPPWAQRLTQMNRQRRGLPPDHSAPQFPAAPAGAGATRRIHGPALAAFAVGAGPRGPAQERARRQVVALVCVVYALVIFEGALRKWVLPEFSRYLFFVRDPVLLLAYFVAARHGLWPRGSFFLRLAWAWAAFGALLFVLQAATGGHSEHRLLLGAYGWRAYFLYVPLAFLVGATFRGADLLRLFRWTLVLAVPVAVLVTAQFFSPHGAPINVGIAADAELQFRGLGLNAERTRPMGPFASGAGQQQFVATLCVVLLAYFIAPRRVPQPSLALLVVATGALLTCIAFSGSRGTVLQCALAVPFAFLVGVVGRGGALKGRAWIWPAVLTVGAVGLYPVLFPEGFSAFSQRWQSADTLESQSFELGVFGRALFGFVDFVRLVDEVPLLGYGLGFGGNAAILLNVSVDGINPGKLVETDFARHMVDLGPLVGILYIVFRFALAAWVTVLVLRATRRSPDPMPMLLLSYVSYTLLLGQITGQGAINAYGWLFTGLLLAACRESAERAPAGARPALDQRRGRGPLRPSVATWAA